MKKDNQFRVCHVQSAGLQGRLEKKIASKKWMNLTKTSLAHPSPSPKHILPPYLEVKVLIIWKPALARHTSSPCKKGGLARGSARAPAPGPSCCPGTRGPLSVDLGHPFASRLLGGGLHTGASPLPTHARLRKEAHKGPQAVRWLIRLPPLASGQRGQGATAFLLPRRKTLSCAGRHNALPRGLGTNPWHLTPRCAQGV